MTLLIALAAFWHFHIW